MGTDADDETGRAAAALVPRLAVIEAQPLAQRAAAYAQLHDDLREVLESGDRLVGD